MTLQKLRSSDGVWDLMLVCLATDYLKHATKKTGLKFWRHPDLGSAIKITGMSSRYSSVNRTILMRLDGRTEDVRALCSCKSGARTLGSCSHSVAVLYWLLDLSRSQDNIAENTGEEVRVTHET